MEIRIITAKKEMKEVYNKLLSGVTKEQLQDYIKKNCIYVKYLYNIHKPFLYGYSL